MLSTFLPYLIIAALLLALWVQRARTRPLQDRLRLAEHRFRGVLQQPFQLIAVLSPEGRVLEISDSPEFSDSGAPLIRPSQKSIVGRLLWDAPWWDRLPEVRAAWPGYFAAAREADGPTVFEVRFNGRSDKVRLAQVALTAMRNGGKDIDYFVLQATDITAARRVEVGLREIHAELTQKADLLTTTLASMSQGILMVGPEGTVSTFNPRICELLDLPPSLLLSGPTLRQLMQFQIGRGDFESDALWADAAARESAMAAADSPSPASYLRRTRKGRVLEVSTQPLDAGGLVRTFTDVTDYVTAERALQRSNLLLKAIQAIADVGGWEVDLLTLEVFWTDEVYRILETSPAEFSPTLSNTFQFFSPALASRVQAAITERQLKGLTHDLELEMITARGRAIWVHSRSTLSFQNDQPVKSTWVIQDITERKRVQARLQESDAVWKLALEGSGDGVWDWQISTGVEVLSQRCLDMYGYGEGELEARADVLDGLVHPDDVDAMRRDREAHFEGRTPTCVSEHRIRCKDGSWKWIMSRGTVISRDAAGKPLRMTGTHTDISGRKAAESLIWQQANFDALTGLPNRRMLRDRLEQDIKKCRREGLQLAVLFLDLDHFKDVNDTLGHDQGDALLVEAGRRIRRCVRESDTVARMGGDEFTVVLPALTDALRVEQIAQKIIDALAAPFQMAQEQAFVSASIGITLYPNDATDIDNLYKHADQALYVAKGAGRKRFSYFTPALQVAALNRARLGLDLRNALVQGQFWIAYQPIVELATGRVRKAEALIRWQHPERGLISPGLFIPIAESSGLINELGEWVFRQAAQQVFQWRALLDPDFQISVNKSPVQFHADSPAQTSWIDQLGALGLPAQSIVLEITEGLLLDGNPGVNAQLLALREAGIGISLDDFGTGYSSLSYLQRYEIDYLKIDQSFVRHLAPGSKNFSLCKAIIVMAHELGMQVIAEGVETEQQSQLLKEIGCDYGQGYLFARPMSAEAFSAFMGRGR